jgi:phenylalanyl-tRNA synthetase beta subunit
MGVLHPQVLENLKWDYPASLIEIDLEPLFRDFK